MADEVPKAMVALSRLAENMVLIICCVGLLLMVIALFLPRWRVDQWGTGPIQEVTDLGLTFVGWKTRSYGLLHVQGSFRQSWSTLTSYACDARDVGGVFSLVGGLIKGPSGGCEGSESCAKGWFGHMTVRCMQYGNIQRVSTATLGISLVCTLMTVVAVVVGFMSKREKYGGITTGLLLFSGFMCLLLNIVWAFASDSAVRAIMESAWFPYPQLGIAWFFHLYAALMWILCGAIFGMSVMPGVFMYDPDAKRIHRHKQRLNFLRTNRVREEVMAERQNNNTFGLVRHPVPFRAEPMFQQPPAPQSALAFGGPQAQAFGLPASGVASAPQTGVTVIVETGFAPLVGFGDGQHYKMPPIKEQGFHDGPSGAQDHDDAQGFAHGHGHVAHGGHAHGGHGHAGRAAHAGHGHGGHGHAGHAAHASHAAHGHGGGDSTGAPAL